MSTTNEATSSLIIYGSVQDVVADRIREMILNDQLKPGDRLQQDELASTLGVSTMPIREALRQLQAEGLVIFYPRRGATVAQLSLSEYEEIFRIREELEILAYHWAAEDFGRISIPYLQQVLTELEEAEAKLDVPRSLQLIREFFFTIFKASEKEHLLRLLSSLWDLSQRYRRYIVLIPGIIPARLEYYRNIYQACEAGDLESLIKAHRELYTFVRHTLIPRLRENEGKRQAQ